MKTKSIILGACAAAAVIVAVGAAFFIGRNSPLTQSSSSVNVSSANVVACRGYEQAYIDSLSITDDTNRSLAWAAKIRQAAVAPVERDLWSAMMNVAADVEADAKTRIFNRLIVSTGSGSLRPYRLTAGNANVSLVRNRCGEAGVSVTLGAA